MEDAIRCIQEGWTPETDDNQSYAVDIDYKAELEADGFTVVPDPVIKDANGKVSSVKVYAVMDIDCPPPPKLISSYVDAVKPYVYASIRNYCKQRGITHVFSTWLLRDGQLGLVSPNLVVILRAFPPTPAMESVEESKARSEQAVKDTEKLLQAKREQEATGKLYKGIDASKPLMATSLQGEENAKVRIVEHVKPFNPPDLAIHLTWYYYMDGELVVHPVNYLTGQWLYDRLAHKVGADGTHIIYAVDDKAKRLVKVDRPEKMKLDVTWSFYSSDASRDRPTYNDYLHDMHEKKVAAANERSAKKEMAQKKDAHEDDVHEAEKLYIRQDRTIDHNALFAYLHDKAESRRGWGRTMVQLPIGAVTAALMQWSKLQQTIDSVASTLKKVESK